MVTSKLEDGIVWFVVEGDLVAQEVLDDAKKWQPQINTFSGYVTDVRKMKNASAFEQKKLETGRKANNTGKPNAILIKDNAMAAIVKIYMRFTKAENMSYFTDVDEAVAWVKSYRQ